MGKSKEMLAFLVLYTLRTLKQRADILIRVLKEVFLSSEFLSSELNFSLLVE